MQSKYEYQVIEDNGGGLHLFVFGDGGIDSGSVIYAATNFEYNDGSLRSTLDALDAGEMTDGWEDGMSGELGDPTAFYEGFKDDGRGGWEVVAQGADGERTLYPRKMGVAAQREFKIDALSTYSYWVAAAIDDNTGTGDTGTLEATSAQEAADAYAAELRGTNECRGEVVRTSPADDSDATDYGEAVV